MKKRFTTLLILNVILLLANSVCLAISIYGKDATGVVIAAISIPFNIGGVLFCRHLLAGAESKSSLIQK